MSIFFPIIIIAITYFLYYYFTRTFNHWKERNVKGPKPIPFFGNFINVALRRQHVGMLYRDLYFQYPEEKVVGLYRMTAPTLLVRDLDLAKQVLIKEFDSFPDRGLYYSRERLGSNMFHVDVELDKTLRRHFSAMFTTNKFRNTFPVLINRADKFLDYIEDITLKKPELDILRVFRKFAVDSIMFSFFGIDVDAYNDDNNLSDIMHAAIQTPTYLIETELLFPGTLFKFNLSAFPERVNKFCQQVIQAGASFEGISKNDRNNIMDVLMALRREGLFKSEEKSDIEKEELIKKIDDILAAQVFILYFAGYGNSSLLATYALYHLAENPDKQEKLITEINQVLEKHDGKFNYDAIKEMKYLELVFYETLRMHPLTNALSRNTSRDVKLEGTDFTIKKDTIVVISPYAIQNDPKYYPEPEKFMPERFLPENDNERHSCAFLTFGLGPRACIGSRFAQLHFEICIAKVLSKYKVEFTKNTVKSIGYTPWRLLLSPDKKIYLNLVQKNVKSVIE